MIQIKKSSHAWAYLRFLELFHFQKDQNKHGLGTF